MQNENEITGAEREIENALRGLKPVASPIDAVACAFEAGVASARGAIWRWRAVAAVLAVAMSVTFVLPHSKSSPSGMIAQAPTVEHLTFAMEPRDAAYLRLRESVLDQGLDALIVPKHSSPTKAEPIPRAGDINWRSS